MDKNAGQIYREIIEGLNGCFGNDNFFKGTQILVDRRNKNNILTTELTPYFYDDTMNFKLYFVLNSKMENVSLILKHKYKNHKLYLYKSKIKYYNINEFVQMFEAKCKEYYLSAEAYFKNKKIAEDFLNSMKTEEFKLV